MKNIFVVRAISGLTTRSVILRTIRRSNLSTVTMSRLRATRAVRAVLLRRVHVALRSAWCRKNARGRVSSVCARWVDMTVRWPVRKRNRCWARSDETMSPESRTTVVVFVRMFMSVRLDRFLRFIVLVMALMTAGGGRDRIAAIVRVLIRLRSNILIRLSKDAVTRTVAVVTRR